MVSKTRPIWLLRTTGLIGIASAALMVCADLVLLFAPLPASDYNVARAALTISESRIIVGDYVGLLAIPFVLVGMYHIYLGLRVAGRWYALVPVSLLSFSYVIAESFHRTVSVVVLASREAQPQFLELIRRHFLLPLWLILTVSAVAGWLFLLVAIWSGRTSYPRWVVWVSPLVVSVFLQLFARVGPPAVTGALLPAGYTLATLLFLVVSTSVLWNGGTR